MNCLQIRPLFRGLVALVYLLALAGCAATSNEPATTAPPAAPDDVRTVTLLAMNDVYRIGAVDGGVRGGLARLRTLRAQLEEEAPDLLLLHAGDLLSPSLLSGTFFGAQMIDVLNLLDGDAEAFDERMLVTFGNHEFDRGKLGQAAQLDSRLAESDFRWVSTNIDFGAGDDGEPLVDGANLDSLWLGTSAGVTVGVFALTLEFQQAAYVARYHDPVDTARRATAELRRRGAELVIGLTHQTAEQDAQLLQRLGEDGPDLVVGGHEHDRLERCVGGTVETVTDDGTEWRRCAGGRPVVKADADARTVAIWQVDVAGTGPQEIRYRWQSLDADTPADSLVAERVDEWQTWFDEIFCDGLDPSEPPGCLETQVGTTRTMLYAEELDIRRFETNLGNWLADQAREAWTRAAENDPSIPRPDLAMINSGSIRLNQNLPAGGIDRRQIEELFPFPTGLALFRTDGSQLQQIVDHSISEWQGSGHFLQISGFAFRHHTNRGTADGLTLLGPDGRRPIRPDEELVVATIGFLVDPSGNQDGYTMISADQVIAGDEVGPAAIEVNLEEQVLRALEEAGDRGIAPEFEGRICSLGVGHGMPEPAASMPCLAVAETSGAGR